MKKITLISDFGCPFCYRQHLAFAKLKKNNLAVELEPVPFMLRSETPMEGRAFSPEEVETYTKQLKVLEAEDPLFEKVHFAPLTHTYNTYMAHLCAQGAKKKGAYLPFALEIFKAYFERGENIGKPEVLFPLYEKIGLDPTETMTLVHADEMRALIHQGFKLSQAHQIHTVPTLYLEQEDRLIPHSTSYEELENIVK